MAQKLMVQDRTVVSAEVFPIGEDSAVLGFKASVAKLTACPSSGLSSSYEATGL